VLRTSVVCVSLALVAGACGGSNPDDGGDAGDGHNDSGRDERDAAPDGTVTDAPTGEDVTTGPGLDAGGNAIDAADATPDATPDASLDAAGGPCSAGQYAGTLAGTYTSSLTIGIPLPVASNVGFTLQPAGSSGASCKFDGMTEDCGNVFTVHGGAVTGAADEVKGDATIGGFPFFCTMTGALDCSATTFVGWIECQYCVGPLADGGAACATSVGGHFAGPETARYDVATHAFVMGTWNASEALAGNDGTMPGPDGAPISDFLSDSGTYLGIGQYGGSGTWTARLP
jgi:hypothetical protein